MFLGLDIDSKGAHFAATEDGESFTHGRVTLDAFPALLETSGFGQCQHVVNILLERAKSFGRAAQAPTPLHEQWPALPPPP